MALWLARRGIRVYQATVTRGDRKSGSMASRQDHKVPNGIGEPHDGGLVDDDDDAIAVDHSDSQAASESKHPHQANGHRIDDIDHEDEDGNDDDGDGDFDEQDESLFHMVNGVRYPRVPISKELGENVILVRDISKGTCVRADHHSHMAH